ncbi:hypothetical protein [Azospirillum brasilense]|uniref:hypothetical protein n=1 Tax=Azospirillum brasilense TaxID=192 RepID=UPI001177F02E|nr:hypothetical protein [Azospirillum brasilense]
MPDGILSRVGSVAAPATDETMRRYAAWLHFELRRVMEILTGDEWSPFVPCDDRAWDFHHPVGGSSPEPETRAQAVLDVAGVA